MSNYEFLAKRIYGKEKIDIINKKIKLLGKDNKFSGVDFLFLRTISSFIVFFGVLFIFNYGYLLSPIVTVVYYYMFGKVMIDDKIKKRVRILERDAMHFFEILTLSLETGRNLEEAIIVTTSNVNSELSSLFKESLREVSFGKSLTESLRDMESKIPSDTINNIILSLTEADIYGNSIIVTLYNQIDYLREKRKLEVKAEIAKVPIKISVISVLFFIPLILLLVLAPVLLSYVG